MNDDGRRSDRGPQTRKGAMDVTWRNALYPPASQPPFAHVTLVEGTRTVRAWLRLACSRILAAGDRGHGFGQEDSILSGKRETQPARGSGCTINPRVCQGRDVGAREDRPPLGGGVMPWRWSMSGQGYEHEPMSLRLECEPRMPMHVIGLMNMHEVGGDETNEMEPRICSCDCGLKPFPTLSARYGGAQRIWQT